MVYERNIYPIWDLKTRANPQALYAQMRDENPIYGAIGPATGRRFWFFTRYEDCLAILKDPRFGKDLERHMTAEERAKALAHPPDFQPNPAFEAINNHLLNMDPPDHTRLRALVHKAFTPRSVENLRPRIEEIANNLLDALPQHGEIDLLAAYGFPLPITVIAEMLGVPAQDRDKFRKWTRVLLFGMNEKAAITAVMEFIMYIHHLIDARQAQPQDDILTALVHAEEGDDKLNRQELLSMVFLLLVAGHETTVNLIGNGTLALLQHPNQMALLRANPSYIESAIEEMLRYNGPVETPTLRWALEDVFFQGHHIQKGDLVMPSLLAANRDPEIFANPDVFDITRNPNRHIAFGAGIHYCLGAPLARLEGQIAIQRLLERLPHFELNTTFEELEWNDNLLLHGMKALPICF